MVKVLIVAPGFFKSDTNFMLWRQLRKYCMQLFSNSQRETCNGRNIQKKNSGITQAARLSRGGCWIFKEIKSE